MRVSLFLGDRFPDDSSGVPSFLGELLRLSKLIDVKSIMPLLLTLVFCILALCDVISGEQFLTIFVTDVGFYFGTQSQKKAETPLKDSPAK